MIDRVPPMTILVGGIATLESGETLLFETSGIAMVRGSTTIGMNSIWLGGTATTSASEPSSTSTVSSESVADAGELAEGIGCRMGSHVWAISWSLLILSFSTARELLCICIANNIWLWIKSKIQRATARCITQHDIIPVPSTRRPRH